MLTRDHIIFDLLSIARAGKVVDDEHITPAQVGFWVDNMRAKLIRQDIDKGRSINPDIVQHISCLDLQQVDQSDCPGCVETGCVMLRSVQQLPTMIETKQRNLITRIGPINLASPGYSIIPYERSFWSGHNKFTKNMTKVFIKNRYVYVITTKFIKKISVSGVFAYPEELGNYSTCAGTPCYNAQTDYYPISNHMIEDLKQMILQADFRTALSTMPDPVNNANGEIAPLSVKRSKDESDN